jgi:hypothetical protein
MTVMEKVENAVGEDDSFSEGSASFQIGEKIGWGRKRFQKAHPDQGWIIIAAVFHSDNLGHEGLFIVLMASFPTRLAFLVEIISGK